MDVPTGAADAAGSRSFFLFFSPLMQVRRNFFDLHLEPYRVFVGAMRPTLFVLLLG